MINDSVYVILKITENMENGKTYSFSKNNGAKICGTCFFISPRKFITNNHIFPTNPTASDFVILINQKGHVILNQQFKIKVRHSLTDFILGKTTVSAQTSLLIENRDPRTIASTKVFSIGFPVTDTDFKLKVKKTTNGLRIISTKIKPTRKNGSTINFHQPLTFNDFAGYFRKGNGFDLNYKIQEGDSGGPLILNASKKVIGYVFARIQGTNNGLTFAVDNSVL